MVSLATFLETLLMRHCYHVAVLMRCDSPTFGRENLKVARNFLTTTGGFQKPSPSEWDEIKTFFQIRNELVHSQQFGTISKRKKPIEDFCKNRTDIRLHHGEVEIEPDFLEYVINQLINFVGQLESEFKMLCERTKSLEPDD